MRNNIDRRDYLKATGAAGIFALAGVGNAAGTQQGRLSWHAGGTGGTYFPLSNEFKTIIEANTDFTIQVQSTGASVENIGSLSQGNADFALIQNDTAFFAYNGEGIDVFEGNPVDSLRGVATLYPETIHVITRADSGVETIGDLSGATINTGDLGSGTQVDALLILESAGVTDFTEQNTGFSQAADQIRNGDVDAAFVVGGWPVGAIEELATTSNINIVEISGDVRDQIKADNSFFADDAIPAGTYNGVDEEIPTVAVRAMIATTADQPADTVEQIVTAIFENADQLTIKADFIAKENAKDGMSIPLHPGAEAYLGPLATETETETGMGTETETGMGTTTTTTTSN